jgi:hypothetical protein
VYCTPMVVEQASKIVEFFDFDVLSVDFIAKNATVEFSVDELSAHFIETNARPNLVLHHSPHFGRINNVAKQYIDFVFNSPNTKMYDVRMTR